MVILLTKRRATRRGTGSRKGCGLAMATSKPLVTPVYTVWTPTGIKRGTAEEVLSEVLESVNANGKQKYSLDEYARALIDNADYHIPKDAWEFLRRQHYPS